MTEADWLTSRDPAAMLSHARREATDRKLRLFACGCCRRLGALLKANKDRSAVELGEWLADREPVPAGGVRPDVANRDGGGPRRWRLRRPRL